MYGVLKILCSDFEIFHFLVILEGSKFYFGHFCAKFGLLPTKITKSERQGCKYVYDSLNLSPSKLKHLKGFPFVSAIITKCFIVPPKIGVVAKSMICD